MPKGLARKGQVLFFFRSSSNPLKAGELTLAEFPVVPWARKKIPLTEFRNGLPFLEIP
jgi:hypothetical protein